MCYQTCIEPRVVNPSPFPQSLRLPLVVRTLRMCRELTMYALSRGRAHAVQTDGDHRTFLLRSITARVVEALRVQRSSNLRHVLVSLSLSLSWLRNPFLFL